MANILCTLVQSEDNLRNYTLEVKDIHKKQAEYWKTWFDEVTSTCSTWNVLLSTPDFKYRLKYKTKCRSQQNIPPTPTGFQTFGVMEDGVQGSRVKFQAVSSMSRLGYLETSREKVVSNCTILLLCSKVHKNSLGYMRLIH